MLYLSVIGNVVADAELKTGKEGKAFSAFRIATRRSAVKDSPSDFYDVIGSDKIAGFLKKGVKVSIVGRLEQREWQAKDGSKRIAYTIMASNVQLESKPTEERKPASSPAEYNDSDVCF